MLKKFVYVLCCVSLFSLLSASEISSPANIFASGNNKFVLPIFVEEFHKKYPDAELSIEYGTSGFLAESILKGAAYDIFLSADNSYAQKVYEAKKALNPPKIYTRGSLIIFIPRDSALEQKKLKVLNDKRIEHIVIANQKTSPYGRAAVEVLKNAKIFASLNEKILYTSDISTVITSVIWYDNAGFLAKSAIQVLPAAYKKEGVNWIDVDPSLYTPIIQTYVVSKQGSKNKNAQQFLEYMHSVDGQNIYHKFGYK